jgi:hypothetical protein
MDSPPNKPATEVTSDKLDTTMLQLAREIAMDIYPLSDILSNAGVSHDQWEVIQRSPRFVAYLSANVAEWSSAKNSSERLKLKSAILLEEWLPTLNNELHGKDASLNAKVEAAKLLAKVAGVDRMPSEGGDSSNGFQVVINLGDRRIDHTITLPSNQYSTVTNELD